MQAREYTYNFYEFFYDTSFHDYKKPEPVGISVKVGTYHVNAHWDPAQVENIRLQHNIDVAQELTAILTRELAQETDREIINQLFGIDAAAEVHVAAIYQDHFDA